MEVLECQLFSEKRDEEIECLAITSDGYFCAVAHNEGFITIFDTITFHLWLRISDSENSSLRNLFFIRKSSNFRKESQLNANNLSSIEYLSDSESDDSQTTACTSPSKSPFRRSLSQSYIDSNKLSDLNKYRLIGLGLDGKIIEWDLSTGMASDIVFSHGGAIFQGTLSPSEGELALACADGSIKIFDLFDDIISYSYSLPKHTHKLLSVAYLNENKIFSGSSDGTILEYDLKLKICKNKMSVGTGKKLDKLNPREISIWCLVCIESENILFTGDSNGTVIVWDLITYTALKIFRNHQGDVLTLSKFGNRLFEKSSLCIVSTGIDGRVISYVNMENNSISDQSSKWLPESFCYPHESYIKSIATASLPHLNGPLALSVTWDGKLALWISIDEYFKSTKRPQSFNFTSRHRYILLPNGILNISPNLQISENERFILYQNKKSLELWFISDLSTNRTIEKTQDLPINPFQITYKKLNDISSTYMNHNRNKNINLIPVQLIKLLELKFSNVKNKNIICSALSCNGNYIVGSFSETGIKAIYIDLENLNISTVSVESCNNIIATCMTFLTNNILIIGGYGLSNNTKNYISTPNIWILDIERDVIVSSMELKLNSRNKSSIGRVSKLNISPDNQWLAVVTNCGSAFIVGLDSLKIEIDFTNLDRDILRSYGKTNYYTPITSICFNNKEKDVVSVIMSDGRYYFYSITLKKMISKEYLLDEKLNIEQNIDLSLVKNIPKNIYSPLLNGPVLDANWIFLSTSFTDNNANSTGKNHILLIRTYESICFFNLIEDIECDKLINNEATNLNDEIEIERKICGPVCKLPRFKKVEMFAEKYLLFPERSIQFIEEKREIKGSNVYRDESRELKSSIQERLTNISLKNKCILGAFWINSIKWLSLINSKLSLESKEKSDPNNGFLIVLSGKNSQNIRIDNKSNVKSIRKRYGE